MTVRVYRSTDTNAPVMSGSPGALVSLLDACLVTGYGTSASAGWTKAFSQGATVAAYKQAAGNGRYLQVTDIIGYVALLVGFETMQGINNGTGQFPTNSMLYIDSATPSLQKSQFPYIDATPRPWMLIATDTCFHLAINTNSETGITRTWHQGMFFGDINSYRQGDIYNTALIAGNNTTPQYYYSSFTATTTLDSTNSAQYMARAWTQIEGAIRIGKFSDAIRQQVGSFPAATDNQFTCSPWCVTEPPAVPRGLIPGIWSIDFNVANSAFVHGQQISFTTGDLAGKTLECHFLSPNIPIMYEISDTW